MTEVPRGAAPLPRWCGPPLLAGTALAGGLLAPRAALEAWLAALTAAVWVPVGALLLLLVGRLFATGWSDAFRAALVRLLRPLPWLAAGFLPVLAGLALLYPWVDGGAPSGWLRPWPFAARALLVWGVWIGLARHAATPERGGRGGAAAGLILLTLSATVAAVDWTMSLEPAFVSSVYGLLLLSGGALAGGAAALAGALEKMPAPAVGRLGALLLTLAMVWGYLAFMQYLVAWSGNRPSLAVWYLARGAWPWLGLVAGAVALKALLPFLALLFPPVRRGRRALLVVAGSVLAGHALDALWLVLPAFPDGWEAKLPLAAAFTLGLGLTLWRMPGRRAQPDRRVRHGRA